MKEKAFIFLTILLLTVALMGCKAKPKYEGNGAEKFFYNRYISNDVDFAENIYLPLIYDKEITSISVEEFDASSVQKPTINVNGLNYLGNYKGYHFHALRLEITEIKESFVIDQFVFLVNGEENIEYQPYSFIIIQSDYNEVDHEEFKLATHVIKYNNLPSLIQFYVITENYTINDIRSTLEIIHTEINEEPYYEDDFIDRLHIVIEPIDMPNHLYVMFNFEVIVANGTKTYAYFDGVESNMMHSTDKFITLINTGE